MTADIAREDPPATAGPSPLPAQLQKRSRPGEQIVLTVIRFAALLSVATTVGIIISLLLPALEFFRQVPLLDFLTGERWAASSSDPSFGVLPLVAGTLWTTVIALFVAVPFGLGAAMYLSEYASPAHRRRLKPVLELLAGVPSVV